MMFLEIEDCISLANRNLHTYSLSNRNNHVIFKHMLMITET